jgi:uncharacterized protein
MQIPGDAILLRIFLGEDERCENHLLYEAIVLKAREMHLAGATVLRGPLGFGQSSRLHTAKILRLSEDLPMIVEIVDSEDKINAFLVHLDGMIGSGLVTLERVRVLQYGSSLSHAGAKPSAETPAGTSAARAMSAGQKHSRAGPGWLRRRSFFARRPPHAP